MDDGPAKGSKAGTACGLQGEPAWAEPCQVWHPGHRHARCWSSIQLHPSNPMLRDPELRVRLAQTAGQEESSVTLEPCHTPV